MIRDRGSVWLNAAATTIPEEEAIPAEDTLEVIPADTREARGAAAHFRAAVGEAAEVPVMVGKTSKIIPGCSPFYVLRIL